MNELAEIHWYRESGTRIIYTDNPELFCRKLRKRNEFFICYPGNMPIPRNKKGE